ncbi:hypothetical protein K458DRAFT_109139 [Lentithecium fluviatile CBS 122367]|uniref:Uncharacterized protein n=1 Tax=Lentithecium fluviatile CBS 122367 TaxID=1168545 RepID=A0A6G1IQM1_9PLEO|nr:hypothetical protein K458DRAFT_109139 [Lentithecium fluviatile CBS 122367]
MSQQAPPEVLPQTSVARQPRGAAGPGPSRLQHPLLESDHHRKHSLEAAATVAKVTWSSARPCVHPTPGGGGVASSRSSYSKRRHDPFRIYSDVPTPTDVAGKMGRSISGTYGQAHLQRNTIRSMAAGRQLRTI